MANGTITVTGDNRIPLRLKETGYEFGVLIESLGIDEAGLSGYVEYLLPAAAGAHLWIPARNGREKSCHPPKIQHPQ